MSIKGFFIRLLSKIDFYIDVFMRFVLEDIAIVILPLAIIIFIRLLRGVPLESLLLVPDWSFASIIIFGLTISKALRLKSVMHKNASRKFDFMIRFFMFLLVITVIGLSVTVLNQEGIPIDARVLFALQFGLLFLGLFSLLSVNFTHRLHEFQKENLPAQIGTLKYLEFVRDELLGIRNNLIYINFALAKKERFKDIVRDDLSQSQGNRDSKKEEIKYLIESVEKSISEIRSVFESKF